MPNQLILSVDKMLLLIVLQNHLNVGNLIIYLLLIQKKLNQLTSVKIYQILINALGLLDQHVEEPQVGP